MTEESKESPNDTLDATGNVDDVHPEESPTTSKTDDTTSMNEEAEGKDGNGGDADADGLGLAKMPTAVSDDVDQTKSTEAPPGGGNRMNTESILHQQEDQQVETMKSKTSDSSTERLEVGGEGRLGTLPPPSPTTLHDRPFVRAIQSKESAYGMSQISFNLSSDDMSTSTSTSSVVPDGVAGDVDDSLSSSSAPSLGAMVRDGGGTTDNGITRSGHHHSHHASTAPSLPVVKEAPGDTVTITADDGASKAVAPAPAAAPAAVSAPSGHSTTSTTSTSNSSSNSSSNNNNAIKPPKLKKTTSKSQQPVPFIAAAADDIGGYSGDDDHDDDDDSGEDNDGTTTPKNKNSDRIRLGICAMDKKARSKPMAEILSRLDESLFHVVFFGDSMILDQPVEEWPIVQVLVAFYSKGYPLSKAKEYVLLRKPFVLNDLDMQEQLKDRRKVYDLLEASGIDVPRHVFLSTDGYVSTGSGDGDKLGETNVQEFDDHIEVNGVSINKPFVEKPVDADDHNIAIYYPSSAGGGCKKLFRKIGNRSSEFYPDINEIRRDGSYIYEEFVETQGTDVKMYTVGPEYGHAEARKSPTVDGKVQRNADGKEIRFPVILTLGEKEIARRIVLQFKQFICGFDLLRVQTDRHTVVSYVCDVNGFSFVKNSRKYYDDCAQILTEHMLAAVKPDCLTGFSTLDPMVKTVDDDESSVGFFPIRPGATLQRVARLLRQGESKSAAVTPAGSDIAIDESRPGSISPPRSETSGGGSYIGSDDPTTLSEGALPVRQIPQELLSEPASLDTSRHNSSDDLKRDASKRKASFSGRMHQEELRCVIAIVRHGDRTPKQKLKVNMTEPLILEYFHKHCDGEKCTKDLKIKAKAPLLEFVATVKKILASYDDDIANGKPVNTKLCNQLRHMRDVLERWKITGLNRKLQIKPKKFEEDSSGKKKCVEVQLILKWGGNLTKLGENQAIRLGQQFRQEMYPDAPGGGILRLHSTFRHDLKIKTSDEGRVMKTAAAFAKGLLELDGEIGPILVSLVHKEKGSMHMLDPSGDNDAKLELDECKEKITANLQENIDWRAMSEEDRVRMVGPPILTAMRDALAEVGNPRETLMMIYQTMGSLIEQLEDMLGLMGSGDEKQIEGGEGLKGSNDEDVALSGVKLYKGETLLELTERWRFIYKKLYDPDTEQFDLSRIPDVHDNVRFDVLHNPHLGLTSTLEKLYSLAKCMADTVVPQEYGTTLTEKKSVGIKICSSLVEKVRYDLNIARTDNKADMRYMINMDYSADLPINTMGRRIRTRLYFTSESHLHTVLNVLRFAANDASSPVCTSPVLSPGGMQLLNDTKEVCYLTQIVLRLFEDTSRTGDDPRRYRVEILFSAGATATPLHMSESTREADLSRLDTDNLRVISRDGLTCQEVEDFFDLIIQASGKEDDHLDVASTTTTDLFPNKKMNASEAHSHTSTPPPPAIPFANREFPHGGHSIGKASVSGESTLTGESDLEDQALMDVSAVSAEVTTTNTQTNMKTVVGEPEGSGNESKHDAVSTVATAAVSSIVPSTSSDTVKASNGRTAASSSRGGIPDFVVPSDTAAKNNSASLTKPREEQQDDGKSSKEVSTDTTKSDNGTDGEDKQQDDLFHRYFYTFVAAGTLLLGAGCLVMAIGLSGSDGKSIHRRRFTRR